MSVLVPVPHSLDDCSFVILPEVWESYASCLVFVPQCCFGNSGSFMVPYKFLDCCSSVKNVMGNLIGIALNLKITLGSMAIFTILIFPNQELGISFHFFTSFLSFFLFSSFCLFAIFWAAPMAYGVSQARV